MIGVLLPAGLALGALAFSVVRRSRATTPSMPTPASATPSAPTPASATPSAPMPASAAPSALAKAVRRQDPQAIARAMPTREGRALARKVAEAQAGNATVADALARKVGSSDPMVIAAIRSTDPTAIELAAARVEQTNPAGAEALRQVADGLAVKHTMASAAMSAERAIAAPSMADIERAATAMMADRSAGNANRASVAAFQRVAGLKADGLYGPQTEGAFTRLAKAWLEAPAKAVADGKASPLATKAFQRLTGLRADGVAGVKTLAMARRILA